MPSQLPPMLLLLLLLLLVVVQVVQLKIYNHALLHMIYLPRSIVHGGWVTATMTRRKEMVMVVI